MESFSLDALEYREVLSLIERYAQTPIGKRKFHELKPIEDESALHEALNLLQEAFYLNEQKQVSWRFSEIFDPSKAIATLRIQNASFEATELLELANLCNQAFLVRKELEPFRSDAPTIWEKLKFLTDSILRPVERTRKLLKPNGEIDDEASPELAKIRREMQALRSHLTRLLERMMRSAGEAVQDEIITQRNDRFVIPVKADFRGKIAGVAHGFSSSGATVFIEPLEAVQANNDLQILKEKEAEEIQRILFNLTEFFRQEITAVENAIEIVAEFDFLRAKLEFARNFRAIVPKISDDEVLELKEARHPLLEESLRALGKKIVPVSFRLTKEKPVMIVSGANAGGKTVVLKTAGILSLMALSGLPVTASQAEILLYKSVLADIGDRQSLSGNLSTFTSHITNIVEMIQKCKSPALVILDEVGTGTDPEEGSALGVAIVDYFYRKCNAQVIASTHYRGLKAYAATQEHVVNASVEFNEKTLEPTYRLLIGFAGASSGIDIAGRFGLPEEIITKAKERMSASEQEINDYLRRLRLELKQAEDLRVALEEEREATAEKYASLEKRAEQKEKIRHQEFAQTLRETLEAFERQAKAFIESLEDKALKAKLEKELAQQKAMMKKQAISTVERISGNEKVEEMSVSEKPIQAGMKVLVKTLKLIGRVEKIEGETAYVLIGSMRTKEKLENLQAVVENEEQKKEEKRQQIPLRIDPNEHFAELNLIGKTTFEIEDEIDRFLDKSYMNGLRRVRIIHGIGTGALRQAVHRFLKKHPHVERFTLAARDQGGEGATVVELKF